ncbi:MAG TPA: hypothetical protein VFK05_07285 [Polyangiaceae bacterium]|nr:hypothetical protein [Polyangiaceae bacterium]
MAASAPGIEFVSAPPERGGSDALRVDVVGFAGVFSRGPILVPRRIDDWRDARRLFGGFFELKGKSRAQAFGPLALYGYQQNGGSAAVVFRLASRFTTAALATAPDIASGGLVGVAAATPGAWANGARVRVPLRVLRRAAAPALPALLPLRAGAIVRVRAAAGIAFGRLSPVAGGLTLTPATTLAPPFVVEELDPSVDVVVESNGVVERFPRLSLEPNDDSHLWTILRAPLRLTPDWQPSVPDAWLPLPDLLALALAQQGPGSSELVRATKLTGNWSDPSSIPSPWPTPSATALATASGAELIVELAGGVDAVKALDVDVFRAAIGALAQHPLPSVVAIPDLMLGVLRAELPRDTPEPRLPAPSPVVPGCADAVPPAPPPAPAPLPLPEIPEEDDLPELAPLTALLSQELLDAVGTLGDAPAERIALLDALPAVSAEQAIASAREIAIGLAHPELGALFYPWLRILDPLAPAERTLLVPASGHVAGLVARVSRKRGPSAPFANQKLVGAVAAEASLDVTTRSNINAGHVCALREIAGQGVLAFGERSLAFEGGPLGFVPGARVLAYLRRLLRVVGQTLVFEPNDKLLSVRVVVTLESLLGQLFISGAFAGKTPAESYRVRCDEVTTTRGDREVGRIIALVDVALAVPLEFIRVRVAFSRDGASVIDDADPKAGDI